jgi:hypothetical protein
MTRPIPPRSAESEPTYSPGSSALAAGGVYRAGHLIWNEERALKVLAADAKHQPAATFKMPMLDRSRLAQARVLLDEGHPGD